MSKPFIPLGDFERANILQSWHIGLTTAEASRCWARAPDSSLLDSDIAQQAYLRTGSDHEGRPMPPAVRSLVQFIGKANLGRVAVRIGRSLEDAEGEAGGDPNHIVVRHARHPTWIALLEEWNHGISIYSRWAHVATINLQHAPSDQDFVSIIRAAQRLSARQPKDPLPAPDYVDPERPSIREAGEDRVVHPPDLVDRVVGWLRDFF